MTAALKNFTIEKGAKWYQEIQITSNGVGKSLIGKTIRCIIKESTATIDYLHLLTEANGGVIVIDDSVGKFALYIPSNLTFVAPDYGVYVILEINEDLVDTDTERVMEGRINWSRGFAIVEPTPPTPEPEEGYAFSDDDQTQVYYSDDAHTSPYSSDNADL